MAGAVAAGAAGGGIRSGGAAMGASIGVGADWSPSVCP